MSAPPPPPPPPAYLGPLGHAAVRTLDGKHIYMGISDPLPQAIVVPQEQLPEEPPPERRSGGFFKTTHIGHLFFWVVTLGVFVLHTAVYTAGLDSLSATKNTVYLFRVSLANTVKPGASSCKPGTTPPDFFNVYLFNYCEGISKSGPNGLKDRVITCCTHYKLSFKNNIGHTLLEALPKALFMKTNYQGDLLSDRNAQYLFVTYTISVGALALFLIVDLLRIGLVGRRWTLLRLFVYLVIFVFLFQASALTTWMMTQVPKPIAAGGAEIEHGSVINYFTWSATGVVFILVLVVYANHKRLGFEAPEPEPDPEAGGEPKQAPQSSLPMPASMPPPPA